MASFLVHTFYHDLEELIIKGQSTDCCSKKYMVFCLAIGVSLTLISEQLEAQGQGTSLGI